MVPYMLYKDKVVKEISKSNSPNSKRTQKNENIFKKQKENILMKYKLSNNYVLWKNVKEEKKAHPWAFPCNNESVCSPDWPWAHS